MPNRFGVYGLCNELGFVYIGKGDIRERLLAHLAGDDPRLLLERPTHYIHEICSGSGMHRRERELILEYDPPCNRHP